MVGKVFGPREPGESNYHEDSDLRYSPSAHPPSRSRQGQARTQDLRKSPQHSKKWVYSAVSQASKRICLQTPALEKEPLQMYSVTPAFLRERSR